MLDPSKPYVDQGVELNDVIVITDEEVESIVQFMASKALGIVRKEEQREVVQDVADRLTSALRNESLLRLPRASQVKAGLLFIAMPMATEDPSLDDVHDAIVEVASQLKMTAQRVDDVQTNARITDQIIDLLDSAQFVVVDLTHARPNVFFEAGYAQGIGKVPVYIAREGTHLEFDLKDYPVIFFRNMRELKERLQNRLVALLRATR